MWGVAKNEFLVRFILNKATDIQKMAYGNRTIALSKCQLYNLAGKAMRRVAPSKRSNPVQKLKEGPTGSKNA